MTNANNTRQCPDCGEWLSTRYSAPGQPHRCPPSPAVEVQATEQLRQAMATALEGPTLRGRLEPSHVPPRLGNPPNGAEANRRARLGLPPVGQAVYKPAHASKPLGWGFAAPSRPNAWAGRAGAFTLGYACGAASGAFVAWLAFWLA